MMLETMEKFNLKIADIVRLLWLHSASKDAINPKELHDKYMESFPGRAVSYDYVARLAKRLEKEGMLTMHMVQHRKYYSTTDKGLVEQNRFEQLYVGRFQEILFVVERIHHHVTNQPLQAVDTTLPTEYRTLFAKIMSVKDVARYMILTLGITRTEFYIAEANDQMKLLYGWQPANAYLYEIAREMEADGTIIGRWKDNEKRTVRLIRVTDDGVIFRKRIAKDLEYQSRNIVKYLQSLLLYLK